MTFQRSNHHLIRFERTEYISYTERNIRISVYKNYDSMNFEFLLINLI